jgi:hypothetical protein
MWHFFVSYECMRFCLCTCFFFKNRVCTYHGKVNTSFWHRAHIYTPGWALFQITHGIMQFNVLIVPTCVFVLYASSRKFPHIVCWKTESTIMMNSLCMSGHLHSRMARIRSLYLLVFSLYIVLRLCFDSFEAKFPGKGQFDPVRPLFGALSPPTLGRECDLTQGLWATCKTPTQHIELLKTSSKAVTLICIATIYSYLIRSWAVTVQALRVAVWSRWTLASGLFRLLLDFSLILQGKKDIRGDLPCRMESGFTGHFLPMTSAPPPQNEGQITWPGDLACTFEESVASRQQKVLERETESHQPGEDQDEGLGFRVSSSSEDVQVRKRGPKRKGQSEDERRTKHRQARHADNPAWTHKPCSMNEMCHLLTCVHTCKPSQ